MPEPIARGLARWALGLRFEDLGDDAVAYAHDLLLDYLGCAIRGGATETAAAADRALAALHAADGPERAAVCGGAPLRVEYAIARNGIAAHSIELDDTHSASSLHPAVVVLPAVLAVGEAVGASGRDCIAAMAAGYEVAGRIGRALEPRTAYERGFHPTAVVGPFATAAAVGRLLGLDEERLAHAFGIAASQAAGRLEFLADGAWTKRFHPGWAGHAGYIAARFAEAGFTGPVRPFEGRDGLLRAYGADDRAHLVLEGIGTPLELLATSIKPHACCRYNQGPIDLAVALAAEHGIGPADVAAVEVGVVYAAITMVVEPRAVKLRPGNDVEAQFSLPFAVGLGIAKGRAFLDEYGADGLADPDVLTVAERTTAVVRPELDARYPEVWPCDMAITTADGRVLTGALDFPRGDPENRLPAESLRAKFRALAGAVLDDGALDRVEAAVAAFADDGPGPLAAAVGR